MQDLEYAVGLLLLIEKALTHGNKFSAITAKAMSELTIINDNLKIGIVQPQQQAFVPTPLAVEPKLDETPNIKPSVYPSDSATATIADRRA